MRTWQHDELADDLAGYLRGNTDRMVWTNLPMGPHGSVRPDVWTLAKSYHVDARAYEIKISVSDFRSDITSNKWRNYLRYSTGVYFAVPLGMIGRSDLPDGAGLIVRGEDTWRAVRKPTLSQQPELSSDVWMKLLMDGLNSERVHNVVCQREASTYRTEAALLKAYGSEVAETVAMVRRNKGALDRKLAALQQRTSAAENEIAKLDECWRRAEEHARANTQAVVAELAQAMGLPAGATLYVIRQHISTVVSRLSTDGEITHLRAQMAAIRSALDRALPLSLPLGEVR